MRIETKKIEIYTFKEADEKLRDKIREYFDDGFLYFNMQERIETLKKVAEILDGNLDCSLSCVPDRGEFITIKPKGEELNYQALWDVINQEKDCPFTGMCYDHDIIDHLTKYNLLNADEEFIYKSVSYKASDGLNYALNEYINSIHKEYEYLLTDEALLELCESNEYEFTVNGKLY